ncbi:Methylenetetrahydrofolate reductase [Modestobacter italicus]|uniref:Methylenetetrahydrofolate reductase n=1 Tax=Modestobacter italicus (strain DSM 44449 / CECT 9708 / BC 501) TaxID=2732864 RepID=I4EU10_MODI5|nr:methylenetetrahydrofolate reductase C-terminal domain-containing protein [Modestobacter marinus]CCH86873.1 Methylenetetrahydrofolate reductase [Modestobacter marinus]
MSPLADDLTAPAGPREGCPKRMVFGPCGGVRDDGRCEVAEHACVFLAPPLPRWTGPTLPAPAPRPGGLLDRARTRPVVLADLTVAPFDPASVRSVVGTLAPVSDGLLVGEHQGRPDLPPTLMAQEVLAAGGRPWTTLACRDRNRLVLEQELAGLAAVGVDGVLCVTGDGRRAGARPEVTSVFDLDGTRLTALATALGLSAAVAESPDAPPVPQRPARVAQKQRAGAQLCVLNHVGSAARLTEFLAAARAAGATLPFVAAVAVYTDERSARVLQRFPGLHLDDDQVERVLTAPDTVAAGIEAAVAEARALLAVPGVVGVNLSGLASAHGEETAAAVKAEVATRIREGVA